MKVFNVKIRKVTVRPENAKGWLAFERYAYSKRIKFYAVWFGNLFALAWAVKWKTEHD